MITKPQPGTHEHLGPTDDLLSIEFLVRVLRKWFWVIVLVTLVLAGTVVTVSLRQPPLYETSTKLLIGQNRQIIETPADAMSLQVLTSTIVEAVNSRPVAEAALKELNLRLTPEQLLANMDAEEVPETQFVQVSYTDQDPERARRIANTIGAIFSERFSAANSAEGSITVTVWEPATTPVAPVSPQPIRNGLLALVLGCMLGLVTAFVLEYFDDRWQSLEETEQVSGVPAFGVIPQFEVADGKKRTHRG